MDGRAAKAAEYPKELYEAICRGIRKQLNHDELMSRMPRKVIHSVYLHIDSMVRGQYVHNDDVPKDRDLYWGYDFVDDVSGLQLDRKLVKAARQLEMEFFKSLGVYKHDTIDNCWRVTGKAPIGVRWGDTNKGDNENPDVRCRLVAQEINMGADDDLYAATPPIEALII